MKQYKAKSSVLIFLFFILSSQSAFSLESTYVKWGGEYRFRGAFVDNLSSTSSDFDDLYQHRIMLNGKFAPNDLVEAHFSFNIFDNFGGQKRGLLGLYGADQDETSIQIFEAYGDWNWGGNYFLKFGRMGLDWGNEAVMSTNKDDQQPYSFDGVILGYDAKSFLFELGGLKIGDWEKQNAIEKDPDEAAYFVSVKLKDMPPLLESAQAYFLRVQSDKYTAPSGGVTLEGQNLNRIGLSLAGKKSKFFYKLDYLNLSGSTDSVDDYSGSLIHSVVGFSESKVLPAKTYFIFHTDSGASSAQSSTKKYRPAYYNHHEYAGLMDLLAWGNLTYYGLGTEFSLGKKNKLMLQALRFSLTGVEDGPSNLSYLGYGEALSFIDESVSTNSQDVTEKALGTEIDLKFKRDFKSGSYVEFLSGVFIPDSYLESYNRKQNIYSFRVTAGFNF